MKNVIMAGFAIFAMFFGSGNLVFPLVTGVRSGFYWEQAVLGFGVTGVLVPALGLFVTTLCHGKVNEVFKLLTKPGAVFLSLFLLSILGPLGVVPRCIVVAYGSFQTFMPSFPLWIFSGIWISVLWAIMPRREKIIPVIGQYLTPLKLGTLCFVVGGSVWMSPTLQEVPNQTSSAFWIGLDQGNHTMDLIASFFFAMSVMGYFKSIHSRDIWKKSLLANLIGVGILFFMYISFIYLGASYGSLLEGIPPEKMLPTIAYHALGRSSGYWIAFTIVISCLTTSVALIGVFCDYISRLLEEKKIFLSYRHLLFMTLLVTFMVSLGGFQKIGAFLGPLLQVSYPFIVFLTVVQLGIKIRERNRGG